MTHLFGGDGYGLLVRRGRQLARAAHELLRMINPRTTLTESALTPRRA